MYTAFTIFSPYQSSISVFKSHNSGIHEHSTALLIRVALRHQQRISRLLSGAFNLLDLVLSVARDVVIIPSGNEEEHDDIETHETRAHEREVHRLDSERAEGDTSESVTGGGGQEVEGGDGSLRGLRSLSVGEVETSDGNEDFGDSHNEILGQLLVDGDDTNTVLSDSPVVPRSEEVSGASEEHTHNHAAEVGDLEASVAEEGVNDTVEDGDTHEDEAGVKSLDLLGENFDVEDHSVHLVGLQHPRGSLLVEECPEDRQSAEDGKEVPDLLGVIDVLSRLRELSIVKPVRLGVGHGGRLDAVDDMDALTALVDDFPGVDGLTSGIKSLLLAASGADDGEHLSEDRALGRGTVVPGATEVECEDGNGEEAGGNREGEGEGELLADDGGEEGGADRAKVDGEVEDVEVGGYEGGVIRTELLATEGTDARLDTTRTDSDEAEGEEAAPTEVVDSSYGHGDETSDVEQGECEDGPEFAEDGISDETTEDRHEVRETGEVGVDSFSLVFLEIKTISEIFRQNGAQTIVREAFTKFHDDDEEDRAGHVFKTEFGLLLDMVFRVFSVLVRIDEKSRMLVLFRHPGLTRSES